MDVRADADDRIERCDITSTDQIERLFGRRLVSSVVHLAAVLPTAFRADPVAGARVNLTGTCNLLQTAVAHGVERFVFGSSTSVYGSSHRARPLTEDDPPAPDDPYGAAKHMVELLGQSLAATTGLSFACLRIARVVGPGARNTASPWRSQMFDGPLSSAHTPISIPFAPSARLGLVHVDDVARMLTLLVQAAELPHWMYNGPAEVWETQHLAEIVQRTKNVSVQMGDEQGGPIGDGTLFARDFAFEVRNLEHYLSRSPGPTRA